MIDESFVDSQKTLFVQMKTEEVSNGISCFVHLGPFFMFGSMNVYLCQKQKHLKRTKTLPVLPASLCSKVLTTITPLSQLPSSHETAPRSQKSLQLQSFSKIKFFHSF